MQSPTNVKPWSLIDVLKRQLIPEGFRRFPQASTALVKSAHLRANRLSGYLRAPEVAMIFIGGHRPRTACASLRPSIEPGICMSVKMTLMSGATFQNLNGFIAVGGLGAPQIRHLRSFRQRRCVAKAHLQRRGPRVALGLEYSWTASI